MQCPDFERDVDSFVDGELAELERLEFEFHLGSCDACRKLVQRQASLKTTLRAVAVYPPAPAHLRRRIEGMLDEEDRVAPPVAPPARAPLWPRLRLSAAAGRLVVPAVAAGLLLLFFISPGEPESPVIAESIVKHQRNLPLEITGAPEVVRNWFDGKVPFAVRAPRLEPIALLRGGRLVSLGSREAAYFIYEVRGNKISVFVFDASGVPLMTSRREVIGTHEVYLEGSRGYNVAVFRDHGLGYAITGSLDEPDLIRLISSAVAR